MKSKFWERIKINKDERFQFLEAVPADADRQAHSIGEMTIDFKGYFTVLTEEVYRQMKAGELQRRCRLLGPYREHLQSRMMYFQSRIALPSEHSSQPEV